MNICLDGVDPPGLVATVVVDVPRGLHQVDLPTGREGSVAVVLRQQPDGRPHPVSSGQASPHLHPPVAETELVLDSRETVSPPLRSEISADNRKSRISAVLDSGGERIPWSPAWPAEWV